MKKMNVHFLILALLVCARSYVSEARAIEGDMDMDNNIEAGGTGKSLLARTVAGDEWIKFTRPVPPKMLQKYGSPVEIICEVMGSPSPTIQWVVGRVPLSEIEASDSNVLAETSPDVIIKVRSVHVIDYMLSEARTYTCVGRVGSQTIYASTTVYPQANANELEQVQEQPFSDQIRPRIIYNERLHLEVVGSNVVLPCKVHARPRAEVFWMNGEGVMIKENQRFKLLPSGDLLITDLKWKDMDTYKCIARNALGKDTADVFIYPLKARKVNK